MYYIDEFGMEINLPRKPSESAVEGYNDSLDTLLEILKLWRNRVSVLKGSCNNPIIRKENK